MSSSQHPKRRPMFHGLSALLILSAGLLPAVQAASVKPKAAAAATASAAKDEVELRFFPLPQQRQQIHSLMRMKVDMRMEPSEGMSEEERAKMEQSMQAAKMPMSMRSEFDQQISTGAVDKQGNFLLQLRGKSLPMEMSNAAGERVGPPKAAMDIKIDAKLNQKTGSFQSMKMAGLDAASSGMSEGLLKQLLSSMSALEGRRLKVGESAEMPLDMALPIPKGPGMDMKMLGRYTLVKLENGVADFDVSVNINMAMKESQAEAATAAPAAASAASSAASAPDAAAVAASAPASPLMTASGQGQGRMSLRVADRLVLSQAMNLAMSMRIHAPGKPVMNMKMDMEMEATGKSLKR